MAAQGRSRVDELKAQIDAMLQRKPSTRRRLTVTDENSRRVFGMSLWDLFRHLAEHFGYEIEEPPPEL